ncbi:conserved hypothetical protein [Vibrio phage 277E43-1]|nr:conserved hypothetical protein [Vibrio phage 277E43-1]
MFILNVCEIDGDFLLCVKNTLENNLNVQTLTLRGCIGTIVNAWTESEDDWTILYLNVKGKDFRGTFNLSEGEVL